MRSGPQTSPPRHRSALTVAILLAACGGSSPVETGQQVGEAALFVDGIHSDTVQSEGQISVRVNGPDGGIDGALVKFRPVWLGGERVDSPFLLSGGSATYGHWLEQISLWTQSGRTQALVRYGTTAGPAGIQVSVESLGLVDTIVAAVLPGAPDSVSARPGDTIVHVGAEYAFDASAADRHGNPIEAHPLDLRVLFGNIEVDTAQGIVRALDPGADRMRWYSDVVHRSVEVAVVPELTVAYSQAGRLLVSDLARNEVAEVLSDARVGSHHDGPQHAWSLDGFLLAYTDSGRIWIDDLAGSRTAVADGTQVGALSWTADGAFVYFTTHEETWRAATDGSGAELVVADGRGLVAPDGKTLALYREPELLLYDLATSASTLLHDQVTSFGWSPDGSRLFVSAGDGIDIIDTSGTVLINVRAPSNPSGGSFYGFTDASFSPDNRFLVAEAYYRLYLIDLEYGRVSRMWLPGTENAADPSLSPLPLHSYHP